MILLGRRGPVAGTFGLLLAISCGGSKEGTGASGMSIALRDVTQEAFGDWIDSGVPYRMRFSIGAGAALGDLDGDGDLDVVLARQANPIDGESAGPSLFMRNISAAKGPIRFSVDSEFSVLAADANANGVALGDYDDDGDLDVFLACEGRDRLFKNDGTGSFEDVTGPAGVAGDTGDSSSGALFVDLNSDGLLDLFVTNFHHGDLSVPPASVDADRLHLNLGDGTFQDVSTEAGIVDLGATHTAAAADLDADGTVDLYVANDAFNSSVDFPKDALYTRRSVTAEGTPIFENVAAARATIDVRQTMGIALGDFDGDGTIDLYLTNWGANALLTWDPSAGVYHERASEFGLANAELDGSLLIGWGALPLDLDHDRRLELFVINGDVVPAADSELGYGQLDFFFRQIAVGDSFDDITALVGLPTDPNPKDPRAPGSGRGAFSGDLDRDGDLDVVLGAYGESFRVYENRSSSGNHFLRLRLTGTTSAPDPVGAVVRVATSDGNTLTAVRTAGGETYGQGDSLVEVSLGSAVPKRVDVTWPSGLDQRVDGLPGFAVDREVSITEPVWLALSARVVAALDPPARLTVHAVAEDGSGLGSAGAGRTVTVTRSDGVAVAVRDAGDGSYLADLVHAGVARRTTLTVSIDDRVAWVVPMISFR